MLKILSILIIFVMAHSFSNSERYYFSQLKLDVEHAYRHCQRNGMDLATENNVQETAQLNKAIPDENREYWIGGIYQRNRYFEYDWVWQDSGKSFDYSNWAWMEPIITVNNDFCLRKLPMNHTTPGQWEAVVCRLRQFFICQKPSHVTDNKLYNTINAV